MQRKSTSKPHAGRALTLAIERVLRPLFRILLRNHMSFKAFVDVAKRTYVGVAAEEFGIPGKKTSVSRVALLSGLTRKEAQRLLDTPAVEDEEAGERYNRAARVVAGWVRDPEFSDAEGNPGSFPSWKGPARGTLGSLPSPVASAATSRPERSWMSSCASASSKKWTRTASG